MVRNQFRISTRSRAPTDHTHHRRYDHVRQQRNDQPCDCVHDGLFSFALPFDRAEEILVPAENNHEDAEGGDETKNPVRYAGDHAQ